VQGAGCRVQLPVFFLLRVECIHIPLAGKCVAAATRLTHLRAHSNVVMFNEFTAMITASISKWFSAAGGRVYWRRRDNMQDVTRAS
jgi:hypothetical protein